MKNGSFVAPAVRPEQRAATPLGCRWYHDAIIYSLDVETFRDSNGDGIGDFGGLAESCRYIASLGFNTLWLLPFYPSPNRDNGYDVMDYYGVDSRLGDLGEFALFMEEAENRGLRVLIDLVLNHTSDQHPWFQQACQSRDNPYHNFYVWRYEPPPDTSDLAIFPPEQKGIWTYNEQVKGWYLHRFYHHQPDLNIANSAVRDEMKKIMNFWLRLGVAGFRVDAVPFLLETRGTDHAPEGEKFDFCYLNEFRSYLSWASGDAVLLAEANVPSERIPDYFGDNDRMHMLFAFLLNERIFLSLARQSEQPIIDCLRNLPPLPEHGQWAVFLRNHDELSLSRLTEHEREECFREFAPDEHMRIFNRGIRRRLAPMMNGDRRRILLAFSLMFTLPGTPVLWYGEEIGMGEDLTLPGRNSVRTPMQWTSERNAGFSTANPEQLIRPVISCGEYDCRLVNAERQEREPDSLLNAVERMLRVRQACPEFGCGEWRLLKTNIREGVLAHSCVWAGRSVGAIHNFTEKELEVTVEFETDRGASVVDVLGDGEHCGQEGECRIRLGPYGYRWFRVRSD